MASGCAVVSTNTWGVKDYLRNQENGLLVPTQDSGTLAVAIGDLLDNPDLVERLATAGRATAEEYSLEKSVIREVRLLEQIHKKPDIFR